jgi:hypothetical protein
MAGMAPIQYQWVASMPYWIGGGGPAHEFERAEVGGEEGEAGDPGGHFAAGQEEVVAGFGVGFEVEADAEDGDEVDGR